MTQSIRRGEHWWHRREDGVWLRWSDAGQTWEPQAGSPPPPPPPPPPSSPQAPHVVTAGVAVAPASAAAPAVVSAAPASVAAPTGTAVALQAPPKEEPVPAPVPAELADTAPLETVPAGPANPNLPPARVHPSAPRQANGEVYSKGGTGFLARFESKTLTLVGGALAIVLIFVLTYMGATLVFRPSSDPAVAGTNRDVSSRELFVMEVDDMCSRTNESATGLPPPGSTAAMADFTRKTISTQRKLISKMSGLAVPEKNKALFRAILKESKVQLGHMHDLVDAGTVGDEAGTTAALERMAGSEKRIDRMSADYGFKECT